jgi:hypothetical protein
MASETMILVPVVVRVGALPGTNCIRAAAGVP